MFSNFSSLLLFPDLFFRCMLNFPNFKKTIDYCILSHEVDNPGKYPYDDFALVLHQDCQESQICGVFPYCFVWQWPHLKFEETYFFGVVGCK